MNINISDILIYIAVLIVIFLLIREILTWYWKINRIVQTLDRIDNNLTYIAEILEEKNPDAVRKLNNQTLKQEVNNEV